MNYSTEWQFWPRLLRQVKLPAIGAYQLPVHAVRKTGLMYLCFDPRTRTDLARQSVACSWDKIQRDTLVMAAQVLSVIVPGSKAGVDSIYRIICLSDVRSSNVIGRLFDEMHHSIKVPKDYIVWTSSSCKKRNPPPRPKKKASSAQHGPPAGSPTPLYAP